MNEKDLLEMKKRITTAKSKVSELTGQQAYLMKELEEEWACFSLDGAAEKLADMQAEADKLDKKIKKGLQEIEENYLNV